MLTPRQKAILHRAIDEAKEQGSAKYVDEFGLPLDVVAYVAMYEGVSLTYIEQWVEPIDEVYRSEPVSSYVRAGLDPYFNTNVDSPEYDGSYFRPAAKGPILVVLQKIWDMSRIPGRTGLNAYLEALRLYMHKLVDTL